MRYTPAYCTRSRQGTGSKYCVASTRLAFGDTTIHALDPESVGNRRLLLRRQFGVFGAVSASLEAEFRNL